jgi:PAS domain S-box-containing protein
VSPAFEDFRLFAEELPTPCWIARPDGYIIWYNRRWHDYCGTTPEAMEGWGWQAVHDPAELPRVMERWQASIASGEAFEMLFPLRGADGVFRPFLTRAAPRRDPNGAITHWFGVNTDVSGQMHAEDALTASEAKYRTLTDAMPQMVWSTLPDGSHDYYNEQWYAFTGVPHGSTDGEGWNDMFHPDDQARAWERWRHSLETGEPYEIEYRLRHHSGQYRWTLGRARPVRGPDGRITRWIGTCTDIDERRRQAEERQLLSQELSHRIKNIFAVITGLVGLSARREPGLKAYAKALTDRIGALARAHEYARPHSDQSRPVVGATTLHGLLADLLAPYPARADGRLTVTGDDVPVDDRGATPLALLLHELATNAAKYGALSTPDGSVAIETRLEDGAVTIDWREAGGPPVPGAPARQGFGTMLAALSVEQQLGGSLERDWDPAGLRVSVRLQADRLVRVKG